MNKEKVKRIIKSLIPWRIRYLIKFQEAKGNIYLSDRVKQIRPIEEYNEQFYKTLEELNIVDFKGKTICELGPGQHLSHAFLEYQMGAEKEWLLEIADFAHMDKLATKDGIILDAKYRIQNSLPKLKDGESWRRYLEKINAVYSITGLDGYKSIPNNSVDYCFSYAVFEHIRKNIFLETIEEMYRFMKVGGICYHIVDFTDHLGGNKNHLRFSETVWEDDDHYKMDNYTNRIQCVEMCREFTRAGFKVIKVKRVLRKHIKKTRISVDLGYISEKDLRTVKAIIVLKKVDVNETMLGIKK